MYWLFYCLSASSVLVLLEAVLEEEESGALILLFLLVGEAESALVVHLLTNEQLHLAELAGDKLDELGGALLEFRDAIVLALILELLDNLLHVTSAPCHELLLGEALDFVKLELVLNVDHSLTTRAVIFFLFISGNHNGLFTLGDVLGLGLDAGTVACDFVGERVREEFISRDQIRVYLHVVFLLPFCLLFSVIVDFYYPLSASL